MSLTKTELINIYQDRQLNLFDIERARSAPLVHYQLWRNFVFAGWMALGGGESAYLGNLTRDGRENVRCVRRFDPAGVRRSFLPSFMGKRIPVRCEGPRPCRNETLSPDQDCAPGQGV
jgi:hypothetical protein